jgi:hypothetical protein
MSRSEALIAPRVRNRSKVVRPASLEGLDLALLVPTSRQVLFASPLETDLLEEDTKIAFLDPDLVELDSGLVTDAAILPAQCFMGGRRRRLVEFVVRATVLYRGNFRSQGVCAIGAEYEYEEGGEKGDE